ncbi:MAG: YihY/virulence factor BrkB family protein [Cyclobacteriaceae bacterium]|nr:YihY/virulence factor BrkB family protein [Cyclobacteriaceae bacterium]
MLNLVKKIEKFVDKDIWQPRYNNLPGYKGILVFYFRVLVLSVRNYVEDKVAIRASALTFFTLLSIVPVLAMGFGIAQGFGVKELLIRQIKQSLEGHQEVFDYVASFADSMLQNTQGGWLAGIGIIVLLWSVIKVLWNIELSFNFIWHVKKQRSYVRMLTDYLAIIVVAPILIVLSGSISIFISTQITRLSSEVTLLETFSPFIVFLLNFSPFVIIWILLTLLYMVMPFTIVNFKSALIAAIVAGSAFQLVQWGYIHFQVGVSRFNAIYGSFAAFPMFLVFLQLSWIIVLFGAVLSYAYQNVTNYEFEENVQSLSHQYRIMACLAVLHSIVKSFELGEKPVSPNELVERYGAPHKMVAYTIDTLMAAGLIAETEIDQKQVYLPIMDIHKMDLSYAINKLNDQGKSDIPFDDSEMVNRLMEKLRQLRQELKTSNHNILIKDL